MNAPAADLDLTEAVEAAAQAQEHTMSSRQLAKRFARSRGYFWLPCPSCGEMFGGHEAEAAADLADRLGTWPSIPDPAYPPGSGRGLCICPACVVAGKGADTLAGADR